jgi:hypothetical protein
MLVAIVLLLIASIDFVQRIYVPRSAASREAQIKVVPLPGEPMPLASAQERLQSWFPASAPQSGGVQAEVESDPGAARTAIPDRVELGGWRFVLRGVFDAGPPFAVFDVMSSEGGDVEQHRLTAGEELNGVRLEEISGRTVSLSDGQTSIRLALFIDLNEGMTPADEQDE